MDNPLEVFEIKNQPNKRIELWFDCFAGDSDPLTWGHDIEKLVLSEYHGTRKDWPENLLQVVRYAQTQEQEVIALTKHVTRKDRVIYECSLRGSIQSDWQDCVFHASAKEFTEDQLRIFVRDCYAPWWRGEVYGLVLSELVNYQATDGTARTCQIWEHINSLWGIIDPNMEINLQNHVKEIFGEEYEVEV